MKEPLIEVDNLLEVELSQEQDFLKIVETLSRIGIVNKKKKELYQSCHILHKRGKYYIVHFKELFLLDGKESNFSDDDKARRNTIACLLDEWGLLKIVNKDAIVNKSPISHIKVLAYSNKDKWTLITKYDIGKKK